MPDFEMCLSETCPASGRCRRHKASGTNPSHMQAYGYHEPDWYGRCPFYLSKPETLFPGSAEIFAEHAAEARTMIEIKHTPGPWSVSFEGVDPEWAIVATQGGRVVANVNADHLQDANARLIAAAPDLLEAVADLISLTRVVRLSVRLEYDQLKRIDRAKAAIAKAEGRQP